MTYRISQGWEPVTTIKLEDDDALGVIDLWTKINSLDETLPPPVNR